MRWSFFLNRDSINSPTGFFVWTCYASCDTVCIPATVSLFYVHDIHDIHSCMCTWMNVCTHTCHMWVTCHIFFVITGYSCFQFQTNFRRPLIWRWKRKDQVTPEPFLDTFDRTQSDRIKKKSKKCFISWEKCNGTWFCPAFLISWRGTRCLVFKSIYIFIEKIEKNQKPGPFPKFFSIKNAKNGFSSTHLF